MKKLWMALIGAAVLGVFANCGNKDQPSAASGMPATCYYQQTSSGAGNYNYYGYQGGNCSYNYAALAGSGFSQAQVGYGGGFNQTAGFMGSICMGGSQAVVYSPTKGLGCVDATRLSMSGQVVTYTLNQQTQTFVPSSAPSPYYQQYQQNNMYGYNNGFGYNGAYGGSTINGMLTVLRVCEAAEPCPAGQSCRSPVGPGAGTGVGLCYF